MPAWSTHVHETAGVPGSRVLVAVTDGRERPDGRTFLVVQGFQSWVEAFEMQRFELIAGVLNARLVVVEVPGFGVAGSRLLPRERRALRAGDFGQLAERMFDAARAVLGETAPEQELSLLGYSMGASVATAITKAAAAEGFTVDQLVLVEPVALRRWRITELVARTRREDRWIADYVATNTAVAGAVAPWDQRPGVRPPTRRYADLLTLGAALRHGRLGRDLRHGVRPRGVIVVRGDRSALSEAAYQPMLEALRRRGVAATELIVPGHHAFWHSLVAVDAMAHQLRSALDTPR
ncbi:alpha/beta fold hydrolase [Mycolicibacterium vanbaalenii]|uniref:AB hydrolase-1 domain-containing protein n=1 Tax=Mycolicibacterium vanbaalenii (strain DSM 7251 / JCM 13017 / BCRC 16820 / KCTC 9966 / NRRL B-24157 / PYR-1) TaxID=350058 RepID=A1THW8_MYCVP|nr:alpha/beta fold hydrolase [Mycolicibacterium vanbaalenii]ABM16768.1 hypothetical protein Mvan_6013 [Mycolicibacterium vanbaalenii PYR-1]MCV7126953.1 alpha/beta fold hydrolase [Mycolicibacterium vanbaalenii PYR-1]